MTHVTVILNEDDVRRVASMLCEQDWFDGDLQRARTAGMWSRRADVTDRIRLFELLLEALERDS